jgi:hypothetical protein
MEAREVRNIGWCDSDHIFRMHSLNIVQYPNASTHKRFVLGAGWEQSTIKNRGSEDGLLLWDDPNLASELTDV